MLCSTGHQQLPSSIRRSGDLEIHQEGYPAIFLQQWINPGVTLPRTRREQDIKIIGILGSNKAPWEKRLM